MTTLSDVCELIVDSEHKTAPKASTGHPMVRTTDIELGKLNLRGALLVDEEVYRAWTRRARPGPGDLILAREAPVGNVGMVPLGAEPCLGQRTVLLRPNKRKIDPAFLNYLLSGPELRGCMDGLSNGATVPHLNVRDIKALPLPPLPSLAEQRRVASILSAYDDLIENDTRRIQILEEMARAIYREWFAEYRFPGNQDAHTVDSELGSIPEGWCVQSVGEASVLVARGVSPKYDDDADDQVVNQRCIRDGRLSMDAARCHRTVVPSLKRLEVGDVLINSTGTGTLGRVAQVLSPLQKTTVDSHVTIVRPDTDRVSADYLGMNLLQREAELASMATGSTGQTELSRGRIADMRLMVPDIATQRRFSDLVAPVRSLAVSLDAQSRVLQKSRDLVLPRLISGDIDVSNLDIENTEPAA
jgi:type I restriction enzyme, S subunit